MHPPDRLARLDAQFVAEVAVQRPVRGQRLRLPPRPAQRPHQQQPQPLAGGVLLRQPGQLGHQLGVPSQVQADLQAALHGAQPLLGQPGHHRLVQRVGRDVVQRRASPQRERLAEQLRLGGDVAAGARLAGTFQQRVEGAHVHPLRLHHQRVSVCIGAQAGAVAEHLAQPHRVHVDGLARRGRRLLTPQPVDEPFERHRTVRLQRERRQQDAEPAARYAQRLAVTRHLERPE